MIQQSKIVYLLIFLGKHIFNLSISLGCIIYEIYTGDKPYFANDLDEYLQKVKDRDIEWNEKLPPKISYLIKKWLSYEHNERPHILEIADFLEAL